MDTLPKESGTLIGISYYSIIIKPLLKLITQQTQLNTIDEYKEFNLNMKQAKKQ